ncbi:MAG: vWA domain-containing protein [Promethearchaeota archaeon]
MSKTLNFLEIKEMTKIAMQKNNVQAVMGFLKSNLYAATSALATQEGDLFIQRQAQDTQGFALTEMFFMIRSIAPQHTKRIMQNLAKKVILKLSMKFVGRGMQKGMRRKRVPYYPGMPEFDSELTILNALEKMFGRYIAYNDIIGIKRIQTKKYLVLILDTSGSMFGEALLNAALTTSILSYVMKKQKYAVILFNENVLFLKHINEEVDVKKLINDILEAQATGFTDIENALKYGLEELDKINAPKQQKIGILITDGNYLRGDHPAKIAKNYPKLHVIGIPQKKHKIEGLKVCRETAKAGKGIFYSVNNFKEIPRALMKILQKI